MSGYTKPETIIPENDEARLKKLRHYEILDTPPENAFDTIALLAAQIFDVPSAFVTFVDQDRVYFKANISDLKINEVRRDESFCSLAILDQQITVFEDTHAFPEFLTNPYVSAEGGIRFYAGAPLKTSEGFRLGTVCVIDSVARKPTAKQLNMLQMLSVIVMEKLESRIATRKILRAHDDRLHMLVHDLKNPMTSISLQSELIGRIPEMNDKAVMIAGKINQQSKNIVDSLNNILSAARDEHGNIKLVKTKVNLAAILKQVEANFGIILDHKNQKLNNLVIEPVEIFADAEKVKDIFENLIGNASKYSETGKEITISLTTTAHKVVVSIQDNGLGLSPDDLKRLFVKFARLSAVPTGRERSNGLGLSIVKMLVDLHKGKVWAQSEGKNMGSTFFVELPVK
ncbi:GAF domain-containing sensor histidine kinase [Pedobacter punctiformis]|uniref:histidine kinase n=1 Tax=Pedobacter punctiformis TaxID=3004097 RepID=A0ABT4L9Y6_9SPHI|nr:GAF domain-containing sensor histidine kinase [Pedobacter sp. HCMS5-2]MCZ4243614.1 GAF domain-containing sensor histidine kinase [Pedobacter sp. HCMS5-2]